MQDELLATWTVRTAALKTAMSQCLGPSDVRLIGKHHPILAKVLIARNRPGDVDAARELFGRAIELSKLHDFYFYECEATVGLAELELAGGATVGSSRCNRRSAV